MRKRTTARPIPKTKRKYPRALFGAPFVLLAAYSLYWIDALPVARPAAKGDKIESLEADHGQVMRISGLEPGPLLSLSVRSEGRTRLVVQRGMTLTEPTDAALQNLPVLPADQIALPGGNWEAVVDVDKLKTENTNIDITLLAPPRQGHRPEPVVYLEPARISPGSPGFRIWAENAPLKIDVSHIADPLSVKRGTMKMAYSGRVVESDVARFELPPGIRAGLSFPQADQATDAVVSELGHIDDPLGRSFLMASGIAIGRVDGDVFVADSFVCGARHSGDVLWWRLWPALQPTDCARSALKLSDFHPHQAIKLTIEGVAFHDSDGQLEKWGIITSLLKNVIVQALVGSAVLGLLGWAGLDWKNKTKK